MKKKSEDNLRRGSGGFTLIELMVVLVLLALIAGLVAPSAVSAMRRGGLLSQGEDLAEMLRFAGRYAVTSRRQVQVNLDGTRGLCWAEAVSTALPWLDTAEEPRNETLATLKLQRGTVLAVQSGESGGASVAPWRTITFKADGRADDALLRLSDGRGAAFEILVIGTDGSVQQREVAE